MIQIESFTIDKFRDLKAEDLMYYKTFNNVPPGFGKTHLIKDIIRYVIRFNMKMVFVMPNHKKIDEFLDEWNDFSHIHLKGKTYEGMCNRDDPNDAYLPGCINLECESCEYERQKKDMILKNVIFMVPQHMIFLKSIEPNVLIVDESIEQFINSTIEIPPRLNNMIRHDLIKCPECPNETCPPRTKKWKSDPKWGHKRHCLFKSYFKTEVDDFEPETLNEYFFKYFVDIHNGMHSIYAEGRFKISGDFSLEFLQDIPNLHTIIYNDATGRLDSAEKAFCTEFDLITKSEAQLNNEIVMLDEVMTIPKTRKLIPQLTEIFEFFNIPQDNSTLVYSKKMFEGPIKKEFPDISINMEQDHYGNCRGFNLYEQCKQVVLVGRFAFRTDHQMLLTLRGETEEGIKWMEAAEEIQAFNRARPYLDDDVKIYLFTNTLKDYLNPTLSFKKSELELALEIDGNIEYLGMNKREITKKIGKNYEYVKNALEILHYLNKINDMNVRGARLSYN